MTTNNTKKPKSAVQQMKHMTTVMSMFESIGNDFIPDEDAGDVAPITENDFMSVTSNEDEIPDVTFGKKEGLTDEEKGAIITALPDVLAKLPKTVTKDHIASIEVLLQDATGIAKAMHEFIEDVFKVGAEGQEKVEEAEEKTEGTETPAEEKTEDKKDDFVPDVDETVESTEEKTEETKDEPAADADSVIKDAKEEIVGEDKKEDKVEADDLLESVKNDILATAQSKDSAMLEAEDKRRKRIDMVQSLLEATMKKKGKGKFPFFKKKEDGEEKDEKETDKDSKKSDKKEDKKADKKEDKKESCEDKKDKKEVKKENKFPFFKTLTGKAVKADKISAKLESIVADAVSTEQKEIALNAILESIQTADSATLDTILENSEPVIADDKKVGAVEPKKLETLTPEKTPKALPGKEGKQDNAKVISDDKNVGVVDPKGMETYTPEKTPKALPEAEQKNTEVISDDKKVGVVEPKKLETLTPEKNPKALSESELDTILESILSGQANTSARDTAKKIIDTI
jgi:hypothetical protein